MYVPHGMNVSLVQSIMFVATDRRKDMEPASLATLEARFQIKTHDSAPRQPSVVQWKSDPTAMTLRTSYN